MMLDMPQTTELLTSPEVAVLLHRSARTIHRLVADGKIIPSARVNSGRHGTFLFTRDEVERFRTAEAKPSAA